MADHNPSSAADKSQGRKLRQRIAELPGEVLTWSLASRLRMILAGGTALVTLAAVFAGWSYLARLAVDRTEQPSLARALFAYDEGRLDDARAIVGSMQHEERPEMFGGALFVLGAVKAAEAEQARSDERRHSMSLIAARYLQKARELGVPPVRDRQLRYLLGKSLIEAQQGEKAIALLTDILADGGLPGAPIDALLVRALLAAPVPDLGAALEHNERVLASPDLSPAERVAAQLTKADILMRQGRLDEARSMVAEMEDADQGPLQLITGRLQIADAMQKGPTSPAGQALLKAARESFQQVEVHDGLGTALTREAMYWMGRVSELEGNSELAREQYDRLSKLYADTSEGVAGELRKAILEREGGRFDRAMAGYRAVLDAVRNARDYSSSLAPIAELRKQLLRAYQDFVQQELFEEAEILTDHLHPLFSQIECTQLHAQVHQRWGESQLKEAAAHTRWHDAQEMRAGRRHLRTAGRAYEDLARLRFGSRQFPEDLWLASENYYRGQSFSSAARVIEEYLRHEVRRLRAAALLRLGQCRLATNRPESAVEAFRECIESFPRDAVVYQARLECARAFLVNGSFEKAEELLQVNLLGDTLTPDSIEWRDSLFELGRLFYEAGRYGEAILKLEEAVARYPDADATLMASYTIARANHAAAEEPAINMAHAKTENERQKNRALLNDFLNDALAAYLTVQRTITLEAHGESSPLNRALVRNCYMMQGAVLYELRRWEDAKQAFSSVSTHYQNDPFVLESYVQIANCWRRLDQPLKARQTIIQAKKALERIPPNADFRVATNFSRPQWEFVLDRMFEW